MQTEPTLTIEKSRDELTQELQAGFVGSEGINLNQFFVNLAGTVTNPNNQPWTIGNLQLVLTILTMAEAVPRLRVLNPFLEALPSTTEEMQQLKAGLLAIRELMGAHPTIEQLPEDPAEIEEFKKLARWMYFQQVAEKIDPSPEAVDIFMQLRQYWPTMVYVMDPDPEEEGSFTKAFVDATGVPLIGVTDDEEEEK